MAPDPDVNDRAVRLNRLCLEARRKGWNFSRSGLGDNKQYECAEQSTRHFHLLIGQSSYSRTKLVAAECASALRGEVVQDSLERDPPGAVLRAASLEINPALVETIYHADAGQRMLHSLRAEQRLP